MAENITIALSGKGGVGKSTIAALLTRALVERKKGSVLAVDADPNSCLGDYLGLKVEATIGDVREEIQQSITDIPPGMTKERWVNYSIMEALVESKGLDMITMGRQEGPGCYCYINNLLRGFQDSMQKSYQYTVIDNEAGMEHLSRRTGRTVDYLFIVSDLSMPGIKAAARINQLSQELKLVKGNRYLVLNKVNGSIPDEITKVIDEIGLDVVAQIPVDEDLTSVILSGGGLMESPAQCGALDAVFGLRDSLKL